MNNVMDAIPAKALISRWRTLLQNCPWRHPITEWMHRVQSVDSDCRVCAAVCARTAPAVLHPKRLAGFVERPQIRS